MKLIQKKFNLKKINIDFFTSQPKKTQNGSGSGNISRDKKFGQIVSGNGVTHIVDIVTTYNFFFAELPAEFVFESRFNVSPNEDSIEDCEKKIKLTNFDEVIGAITSPQEISMIKDIMKNFGVTISDALQIGEEFNI